MDEGLNNKEMNEQLLNYLTCGDVHPNVLGQYIHVIHMNPLKYLNEKGLT